MADSVTSASTGQRTPEPDSTLLPGGCFANCNCGQLSSVHRPRLLRATFATRRVLPELHTSQPKSSACEYKGPQALVTGVVLTRMCASMPQMCVSMLEKLTSTRFEDAHPISATTTDTPLMPLLDSEPSSKLEAAS
jgi:hypothetical protein